jgi:hypothetical protein
MVSDTQPTSGDVPAPQVERPRPATGGGSPSPLAIIGGAFATGWLLAKLIDWRGYAHPRR